jgi:hypothetical protein
VDTPLEVALDTVSVGVAADAEGVPDGVPGALLDGLAVSVGDTGPDPLGEGEGVPDSDEVGLADGDVLPSGVPLTDGAADGSGVVDSIGSAAGDVVAAVAGPDSATPAGGSRDRPATCAACRVDPRVVAAGVVPVPAASAAVESFAPPVSWASGASSSWGGSGAPT